MSPPQATARPLTPTTKKHPSEALHTLTTTKKAEFVAQVKKLAAEAPKKGHTHGAGAVSTTGAARAPVPLKNDVFTTAVKNDAVALGSVSGSTTPVSGGTPRDVFGILGTVPLARVEIRTLLADGLNNPTAVAVNPNDQSVWIVNRGDDSSVVVKSDGTARRYEDTSAHFMNNPMALAFSKTRNELATVQETTNDYNEHMSGNEFMGPTLWTANLSLFDGGPKSHLDMLHHSPNAVGIAAGADSGRREYWVFNGEAGSVDRYFFNQPHVLGAEDHTDGTTTRYVAGQLKRVAGVPSHMALDDASGTLFIADTGNGRVVALDTKTASAEGQLLNASHAETPLLGNPVPKLKTVVARGAVQRPSGLLLKDGQMLVGDFATGHIKVFSLSGELKGDLNTGLGPGTLTGLVEINGQLAALDSRNNRLVEISVRP